MLDRFARNQYDHHALKASLMKLGITLRSVAQPIDDSATGQLMDGILAAFSEFDNNLRRDRTLTGMKAAAEKGRWTFPTPLGYRKALKPNGTKTIEPDPEVAPLIRKAFELAASGLCELSDVLDEMRVRGLRGRRGQAMGDARHVLLIHLDHLAAEGDRRAALGPRHALGPVHALRTIHAFGAVGMGRGCGGRALQLAVQFGGQGARLLDAVGQGVGGFIGGRAQVGEALLGAGGGDVQLGHGLGEAIMAVAQVLEPTVEAEAHHQGGGQQASKHQVHPKGDQAHFRL